MANDIDGLHHIGLVGRDLARLAAQYERLGFALTPVSLPRFPLSPGGAPEPVGAGNRHAIFRDSYLELLGVLDRPRWDVRPEGTPEPAPEPKAQGPKEAWQFKPTNPPFDLEPEEVPAPGEVADIPAILSSRRERKSRKAEARRESRRRKLERLRA